MTFWDFLMRLPNVFKIIFVTMICLIPICTLYFYKYMELKDMDWYIVLSMLIAIVMLYYLLTVAWSWMFLEFIEDGSDDPMPTNWRWVTIGATAFIEAAIFAAIAYIWIENPRTFWFTFFGFAVYRNLICGALTYVRTRTRR